MEYVIANLNDIDEIIKIKDEVKLRLKEEKLNVWLGDYPTYELIYEEIKNGRGRIVKENNIILGYASLHHINLEYPSDTFCHNDLYSFSRLMTRNLSLNRGIATFLINNMLNEVKDKCYGFGLIVDSCNIKAINLYKKIGFKFEGYSKQIYGDFINLTYYYNNNYLDLINYDLANLSSLNIILFNKKLYKTKYKILGVKIKDLRLYSKKLDLNYFNKLNDNVNIENLILASCLLKKLKEEELINKINLILKYCDNWAVCDSIATNVINIAKNPNYYLDYILSIIKTDKEFYVRCAIVILLNQYKKIEFYDKIKELIKNIKIDTYYVNMAIAWLFCKMSFNDSSIIDYVKNNFNLEINKMFLQKRRDSLRERKIK